MGFQKELRSWSSEAWTALGKKTPIYTKSLKRGLTCVLGTTNRTCHPFKLDCRRINNEINRFLFASWRSVNILWQVAAAMRYSALQPVCRGSISVNSLRRWMQKTNEQGPNARDHHSSCRCLSAVLTFSYWRQLQFVISTNCTNPDHLVPAFFSWLEGQKTYSQLKSVFYRTHRCVWQRRKIRFWLHAKFMVLSELGSAKPGAKCLWAVN